MRNLVTTVAWGMLSDSWYDVRVVNGRVQHGFEGLVDG
jgi:hypothetical protein